MKKAFTLIELLVVIAIIAILAAILFPVFAQAKAAAKKTAALSNVKQNATAVLLYNNDSDDTFAQSAYCADKTPNGYVIPASGCQVYSVYDAIMPYTKNKDIFLDPADPKAVDWKSILLKVGLTPYLNGATSMATATNYINYAGLAPNFAVFEDPGVPPTLGDSDPVRSASSIDLAAETSMFFSAKRVEPGQRNDDADPAKNPASSGHQTALRNLYMQPAGYFSAQNFPAVARHTNTLVVNFVDGHAKALAKNFQFTTTAPDGSTGIGLSGPTNVVRCYNLPYDLNGIPNLIAEPNP